MKKPAVVLLFLLSAAPAVPAQTPGNALHFDGQLDYVGMALPPLFTNLATNDFTVETWLRPEASSGSTRVFFAQYSANQFFSILLNNSNAVYAYVYNGGVGSYKTTATLPYNQWSHLAVTWDASAAQCLVYINGVPDPTSGGGSSTTGNNNSMALGGKTDGTQTYPGALDEFRIWDYVRTPCEIIVGMSSEYTVPQPGLVAYYAFNQGVAGGANAGVTLLNDFTGTYNGTLNYFGLNGPVSNWIASMAGVTQVNQTGTAYAIQIDDTICTGDTYLFGSAMLAMAGTYVDSLVTVAGCDSVVTLNLSVITVDTSVTMPTTVSLLAGAAGASYQWLDCSNGFVALPGDTAQLFTATANGNYAVQVTQNGCTDTSACFAVTAVSTGPGNGGQAGMICFPNPTDGSVSVHFGRMMESVFLELADLQGRRLAAMTAAGTDRATLPVAVATGVYLLHVRTSDAAEAVFRIVRR